MKFLPIIICTLMFSVNSFAEQKQGTKEILIDNDKVQLVKLTYPVGSESGMHTHKFANRTVYFVKGGKIKLVPQDANKPSQTLNVTDGKALYMPANTHNVINVGTTEVVIIENEIK